MAEYRIAEILAYAVMKSDGNGAPDVEVERHASLHDARAHVSRLWEEEAAKAPKDAAPVGVEPFVLTRGEADRVRQWFDNVFDVNRVYLEREDAVLAVRLYEQLGMRVPDSLRNFLSGAKKDAPR